MKSTIRKQILKQRKQLAVEVVKSLSLQVCDKITQHPIISDSKVIAIYYPFANEVDLTSLFVSFNKEKQMLLPKIISNQEMHFLSHNKNDELIANKYGILEPNHSNKISADNIDLCLMPLVGFNRAGHRLGMGAGYYDRYFAKNNSSKKPTILAGVAYDFQENATIQNDAWDIPLNYIFTNQEIIKT